jgi:hypothetical protein
MKTKIIIGSLFLLVCWYGTNTLSQTESQPSRNQSPQHGSTPFLPHPASNIKTEHSATQNEKGSDNTYTDRTGFRITFYSPGELLFTDPQGHRVGYDPRSRVSYHEIPLARYDSFYIEDAETGDPGPEIKELEVAQPVSGNYQLQVIGTGTGKYTLRIRAYDPDLNPSGANFKDIAITPGEVHSYGFNYAKTVGSPIQVVPITGVMQKPVIPGQK